MNKKGRQDNNNNTIIGTTRFYIKNQTRSDSSGSSLLAQYRHRQHRRHGAARMSKGEARRTSTPNPAKIPMT